MLPPASFLTLPAAALHCIGRLVHLGNRGLFRLIVTLPGLPGSTSQQVTVNLWNSLHVAMATLNPPCPEVMFAEYQVLGEPHEEGLLSLAPLVYFLACIWVANISYKILHSKDLPWSDFFPQGYFGVF